MKQPYRVVEPIKYGHHHFDPGSKVEMEPELGDELCERGLLEDWPESEADRAARIDAELKLQSDLQRAELEKAERELAEQKAREAQGSTTATTDSQASSQAGAAVGAPAAASADMDTPQRSAGSDDASPNEARDSQDAQSSSKEDSTGASAGDASAPESSGSGTKKKAGKK